MKALFVAAHESESGPKQTWRRAPLVSAFGGQSGHPLGLDECPLMTLRRPRPRPSRHRGLGRQLRQPYSSSRNFAAHEWVLLALDAT